MLQLLYNFWLLCKVHYKFVWLYDLFIIQFFLFLIGAPARTFGWRHPGYIHTSFLKDLWPNAMYKSSWWTFLSYLKYSFCLKTWWYYSYTYKLGHQLLDGTYVWSKKYSFKASPYPGQDSLQRVIIFGDMGKVRFIILYFYESWALIYRKFAQFNLRFWINSVIDKFLSFMFFCLSLLLL